MTFTETQLPATTHATAAVHIHFLEVLTGGAIYLCDHCTHNPKNNPIAYCRYTLNQNWKARRGFTPQPQPNPNPHLRSPVNRKPFVHKVPPLCYHASCNQGRTGTDTQWGARKVARVSSTRQSEIYSPDASKGQPWQGIALSARRLGGACIL